MSMKKIVILLLVAVIGFAAIAQETLKKVYDENIDPMEQIDQALAKARSEGKFVVCQVGGNWCPWCLRFVDFITKDEAISKVIDDNFVYIHVNYNPRKSSDQSANTAAMMKRLGNPARFGFPVFVILDTGGKVIHIQDSGLLEKDKSYDRQKVLRFLSNWTPKAVRG